MTALGPKLDKLGLVEYSDRLFAEGFDTWESICDVTESDLNELNVKLGHRRKLQRAISDFRIQTNTVPLVITLGKRGSPVDGPTQQTDGTHNSREVSQANHSDEGPRTKRKYRRHPKPDENAPERPPSAYVIFSNYMREQLKGQELSFTDMAKVVGEKWQLLSADSREHYEKRAGTLKETFNTEFANYKKTSQYAQYQDYLAEFKAKNGQQEDGRRAKLVPTESTGSTASVESAHDSRRRKNGNANHPPMLTESTTSTLDSPSPSTTHASGAQSPQSANHYSATQSAAQALHNPQHNGYLSTTNSPLPGSGSRQNDTRYPHPSTNGMSPPGNARYATQDLPYSHGRTSSSHFDFATRGSPASSNSSLPPLQPGPSHYDNQQPYPYQQQMPYPSIARGIPGFDGISARSGSSAMMENSAVRSYRHLPLPAVRSSSNNALLPPMAPPPSDARGSSSLATLLLAAKEAEKGDMLPSGAQGMSSMPISRPADDGERR